MSDQRRRRFVPPAILFAVWPIAAAASDEVGQRFSLSAQVGDAVIARTVSIDGCAATMDETITAEAQRPVASRRLFFEAGDIDQVAAADGYVYATLREGRLASLRRIGGGAFALTRTRDWFTVRVDDEAEASAAALAGFAENCADDFGSADAGDDDDAWAAAEASGAAGAYALYLETFPEGAHAERASARIDAAARRVAAAEADIARDQTFRTELLARATPGYTPPDPLPDPEPKPAPQQLPKPDVLAFSNDAPSFGAPGDEGSGSPADGDTIAGDPASDQEAAQEAAQRALARATIVAAESAAAEAALAAGEEQAQAAAAAEETAAAEAAEAEAAAAEAAAAEAAAAEAAAAEAAAAEAAAAQAAADEAEAQAAEAAAAQQAAASALAMATQVAAEAAAAEVALAEQASAAAAAEQAAAAEAAAAEAEAAEAAAEEERRRARATEADEIVLGLSRDERRQIQSDLTALGFSTRGVDGDFGPGTRAAIRSWQAASGLPETGFLNEFQLVRLGAAADAQGAPPVAPQSQTTAATAAPATGTASSGGDEEERIWTEALNRDDMAGYTRYLRRYKDGRHAAEARQFRSVVEDRLKNFEASLSRNERKEVKARLAQLGYDVGKINAKFGGKPFRRAVREFRKSVGLPLHRFVDQAFIDALWARS